jgi:hypothetical protein
LSYLLMIWLNYFPTCQRTLLTSSE